MLRIFKIFTLPLPAMRLTMSRRVRRRLIDNMKRSGFTNLTEHIRAALGFYELALKHCPPDCVLVPTNPEGVAHGPGLEVPRDPR